MQGVVDHHLRDLLTRLGGLDGCVTEFIRVTDHCLPPKVFLRLCPELAQGAVTTSGTPVKVQLLGSNPQALAANALKAAELGATAIDLNFGCPAKTVNNHCGGAKLLNDPPLIEKIVYAVRSALPESVSLSAKIRLGYESRNAYLAAARAVENGGAEELVIHARSKTDGYRPPAYWHLIAEIRANTQLALVANGEVWSPEDWQRCREMSLVPDVMLGRGILARPDLALAIKSYAQGKIHQPMSWYQTCQLLHQYHQSTKHHYPVKYLGNRVKQWLAYLRVYYPEADQFLESTKRCRDDSVLEKAFAHELAAHHPPLTVMEA